MTLNLDWLNSITYKSIHPGAVQDYVFRNAALLAYLRKNRFEPYEGGVSMDEAIMYDSMIGGAYSKGEPFNTDVVEPFAGITFPPRTYYESIADYLENIAINRGSAAVFNHLKLKHAAAINSINTQINVALYRHGQNIGAPGAEDRSKHLNGLEEAFNDGVTQSWYGHIFPAYAGQNRNQEIGEGLNAVPYFCGNSSTGAAGQFTYDKLLDGHLRASKGNRKPTIGLSNKGAWGFLLSRIQSQQTFNFGASMGSDAVFGATSIKFMNADIMVDEYAPSAASKYGKTDPKLGDWTTATSVTISGTPATGSNLPASGTYVPGEVFLWINDSSLKWRNSTHPLFNWGFTGYKPSQNSTKIVGQILVMGNLICNAPWLNVPMFGINS